MPCYPIYARPGYRTQPDRTKRIIRKISGFICVSPDFRLRLDDGRHVFMTWHHYCGPNFYHDRSLCREILDWWEDKSICAALDWFQGRGNMA